MFDNGYNGIIVESDSLILVDMINGHNKIQVQLRTHPEDQTTFDTR